MKRGSRTMTIGLGHACCTGALCAHGAAMDERALSARLRGGGRQLALRGVSDDDLARVVALARGEGFADVVLASAALDRLDATRVRASGVDAVRAIVFSHVPSVHDRIAGREHALVGALVTLRELARQGLPLELELPLLPLRLSDPREVVELALRAVGTLRAVRFVIPVEAPASVAPPRLDALSVPLAEAMRRAIASGAEVALDPSQGIPPCALPDATDLHPRFVFRWPERNEQRVKTPACERCALLPGCGGPTPVYARAHGEAGLAPFASRPSGLRGRRTAERPRFGAREREAARHIRFLVLRPTVHCNQDCLFCSANESSGNAFSDPKTMLKAVARAAQRGVRRISFSGGEPTLSPHLPHFVAAARRAGVPEVELVTNGVLLDREAKVKRLAEAGLTHAFVSLHAHDEALSRTLTQKEGDHARTLRAIALMLDAGVRVAVNHVVTARNQPYLRAFVEMLHARFGGRVFLSFAFVTPQYKALEHPELWPRLAETRAYLAHAMHRAIELGQPFIVGSRQGVPPCVLGPFAAWSDVFGITAEAASEDAPQKVHGPACARCRYRAICTGLWRPYAARFGFDELAPIEGEPFTDEELRAIREHHRKPPWGVPLSFDEAPPLVRDRAAEREPLPPLPATKLALPVHRSARTRPLRVLLVGSGVRARELAERAAAIPELAIAAVASPHAPDAGGWHGVPLFRDARAALDEVRPEAAIVAAATDAHVELVHACASVPVLLEKPVAPSAEAARVIDAEWVSCALQELFAPGLEDLSSTSGLLRVVRRVPPDRPDAPRSWGPAALRETLHHALSLVVRARGEIVSVESVRFEGAGRPAHILARLATERGPAELKLDFAAAQDELAITTDELAWRRRGSSIERDGRALERDGSDEERMLRAFVRAVVERGAPPVPLREGTQVLAGVEALLAALMDAGAPLVRAGAPKHVASRRYRMDRSRR